MTTRGAPHALPVGARLLHVGPPKTATSSIQSAFHLARARVRRHGVHYAGRNRQPLAAAQAAAARQRRAAAGSRIRPWLELLREIEATDADRVVISSEWFADADDRAARLIVEDLDPERLHVAITLRPLAAILPSQWQQYVQGGLTEPYERWLERVLERPTPDHATVWRRHRHDELVARWSQVGGPQQLTVIVAERRDQAAVLRAFESLAGLPDGVLVPDEDRTNRSLSYPEAEVIRALNAALAPHVPDPRDRLADVMFGAAANLRSARDARTERRIETPAWARDRIAELSGRMVAAIRGSGVRVVGDLDALAEVDDAGGGPEAGGAPEGRRSADTDPAWAEVAAAAAMGVLAARGLARRPGPGDAWPDDGHGVIDPARRRRWSLADVARETAPIPSPRLQRILVSRVRRKLRVRLGRDAGAGSASGSPTAEAAGDTLHSIGAEVE